MFGFVDLAMGTNSYQNITGVLWFDGVLREINGGVGVVWVYSQ